jgi:hypothetical protein
MPLIAYTYRLIFPSIIREIDAKFTIHDLVVIQIPYCGCRGVCGCVLVSFVRVEIV